MRAMIPRRAAILVLVLALALALVAAACGGSGDQASTTSSAAATAADGRSAEQIVKDSEAKMATVKSASFTADAAMELQGDTSKITDPTAAALLSQGISVHAEGKAAMDSKVGPVTDTTVSLGIAGQTLEFGMKAVGKKAWLEYQGTWYKVDGKNTKALDVQSLGSGGLTQQLKSMGFDVNQWGMTYELLGTEDLSGVQVYHIKGTADTAKMAESLTKAAADPNLGKELQGVSGQLGQLTQGLKPDAKQAEEIAKGFKSATWEYWIGVDDQYTYKSQAAVVMDMSALKDNQGISGLTVKGTMAQSDFDQAFEVTKPAGAKPFEEFMNQLFGGMLGGGMTF
jgi:hypothetical protein